MKRIISLAIAFNVLAIFVSACSTTPRTTSTQSAPIGVSVASRAEAKPITHTSTSPVAPTQVTTLGDW